MPRCQQLQEVRSDENVFLDKLHYVSRNGRLGSGGRVWNSGVLESFGWLYDWSDGIYSRERILNFWSFGLLGCFKFFGD